MYPNLGQMQIEQLVFPAFQQWFTVLEHYNRTSCTVSDLIIGNSYSFRVFSENHCGLSEKPAVTKDVAHIKKTGKEHNNAEEKGPPLSMDQGPNIKK